VSYVYCHLGHVLPALSTVRDIPWRWPCPRCEAISHPPRRRPWTVWLAGDPEPEGFPDGMRCAKGHGRLRLCRRDTVLDELMSNGEPFEVSVVDEVWCPTCETALRDTLNVMAGHREWADIVNENRIDPDQIAAERTLFDVLLRLTLAIVDGNAVTVQPNEAKAILTAVEG
jgi:hypothetical protein